jgi:hypothetical protein
VSGGGEVLQDEWIIGYEDDSQRGGRAGLRIRIRSTNL